MELWLDSIDKSSVEQAKELGLLHGVTTNPSILSNTSLPAEEVLDELLNCFSGPIAVQVTLRSAHDMIEQGKDLYDFSSRIVVKIPVTAEGIHAISRLHHAEIPTMATTIFDPLHAFLAAQAGATYVVPYFSHLGEQALDICSSIQTILKSNHLPSKLLVASLRTPLQVQQCVHHGFSAVTLTSELFKECLLAPTKTIEFLDRFESAWKNAPISNILSSSQYIR